MEIALTRMSSKGQIVIPAEMREDMFEGEQLLMIKNDAQIILKKASSFSKTLEDDVKFAKRTEEALKRYERGKFISRSAKDFLKELEQW